MSRDVLIPDPLSSDRQYERFHHFDIEGLEDTELTDELYALRPLLWWGLPAEHWLRERVKMLEAEAMKRKINIRQEFRAQPKPKLAEGVKL
jgi:hypothetical protein